MGFSYNDCKKFVGVKFINDKSNDIVPKTWLVVTKKAMRSK